MEECVLPTPDDPYAPELLQIHAGKVFVMRQNVLGSPALRIISSDGSDPAVLKGRHMLCLWDLRAGASIWISIQSDGEFEIPVSERFLLKGKDENWLNADGPSRGQRYRDGTIWFFQKRTGAPFEHRQTQQRGVRRDFLETVRGNISITSFDSLLAQANIGQ